MPPDVTKELAIATRFFMLLWDTSLLEHCSVFGFQATWLKTEGSSESNSRLIIAVVLDPLNPNSVPHETWTNSPRIERNYCDTFHCQFVCSIRDECEFVSGVEPPQDKQSSPCKIRMKGRRGNTFFETNQRVATMPQKDVSSCVPMWKSNHWLTKASRDTMPVLKSHGG